MVTLRFKNNLSMVKRVYVNAGAYEHSKGIDDGTSYESISTLYIIIPYYFSRFKIKSIPY